MAMSADMTPSNFENNLGPFFGGGRDPRGVADGLQVGGDGGKAGWKTRRRVNIFASQSRPGLTAGMLALEIQFEEDVRDDA
jgi:hypothetical protein